MEHRQQSHLVQYSLRTDMLTNLTREARGSLLGCTPLRPDSPSPPTPPYPAGLTALSPPLPPPPPPSPPPSFPSPLTSHPPLPLSPPPSLPRLSPPTLLPAFVLEIWSEPFVWSAVLPFCAAIIASCCCLIACFCARLCVLRRRHGKTLSYLEEVARCSECSWALGHARAKTKMRWVPLQTEEATAPDDDSNILAAAVLPAQNGEAERRLFHEQSYVI